MTRWLPRYSLAVLLLLATASLAFADLSKLDPTARIALQRLRGGEQAPTIQAEGRL